MQTPIFEIDGEPYWDGGYTGNPALTPLLRKLPGQKIDLILERRSGRRRR